MPQPENPLVPLPPPTPIPPKRKLRGFAALSPERMREISSKGGKSAQASGLAHQFTSEEARIAGKLGGRATASKGSEYMSQIGKMNLGKSRKPRKAPTNDNPQQP